MVDWCDWFALLSAVPHGGRVGDNSGGANKGFPSPTSHRNFDLAAFTTQQLKKQNKIAMDWTRLRFNYEPLELHIPSCILNPQHEHH